MAKIYWGGPTFWRLICEPDPEEKEILGELKDAMVPLRDHSHLVAGLIEKLAPALPPDRSAARGLPLTRQPIRHSQRERERWTDGYYGKGQIRAPYIQRNDLSEREALFSTENGQLIQRSSFKAGQFHGEILIQRSY